jgi:ABC-type taurine transport system ATPase subunit
MTALQRYAATRVAPPIFAMEIVLPVALAPWLFHEDWTKPGLVLLGLGIVVAAGIAVASAPAVVHLQEEEAEAVAAESGGGGDRVAVADEPEHDVGG